MAVTHQIAKTAQSVNETRAFPLVTNKQTSCGFVKRLFALSVSNIAYLRALFPNACFSDQSIDDDIYKVLRADCENEEATYLITSLKGVLDAIEKRYARRVELFVSPKDDIFNPYEAYTFFFRYDTGGTASMDIKMSNQRLFTSEGQRNLRSATTQILRLMTVMMKCTDPLPKNLHVWLRITYLSGTPEAYEASTFAPSQETTQVTFKPNEWHHLDVGQIDAYWHKMGLRAHIQKHRFDLGDDDPPIYLNDKTIDVASEDEEESGKHSRKMLKLEVSKEDEIFAVSSRIYDFNESPFSSPAPRLFQTKAADKPDKQSQKPPKKQPEKLREKQPQPPSEVAKPAKPKPAKSHVKPKPQLIVLCLCEDSETDGLMIQCNMCLTWQHAACFSVLGNRSTPKMHVCLTCLQDVQQTSETITDPSLLHKDPDTLRFLCQMRRLIVSVQNIDEIHYEELKLVLGTDSDTLAPLIKELVKRKVIHPTDDVTFTVDEKARRTAANELFFSRKRRSGSSSQDSMNMSFTLSQESIVSSVSQTSRRAK